MADRLLRHPVPYLNESIGNYVLRICSENSCELSQFASLIGFYHRRSIENYYNNLSKVHISKFYEITGIDIKSIEDMTEKRFRFDDYSDYRRGIHASVCPKCYSERPYERIHWKNKLISVCLEHEIYLVNKCPRCNNEITSNFLYNGKCDCGLPIKYFNYVKCINEYIIRSQKIMYQIFNIKTIVPLNENDFLYNTMSGKDYCIFFYHLQKLATLYDEDIKEIGTFCDVDDRYISNIFASWIILEWPVNLITILNILNDLDIKYINRSSFEDVDLYLYYDYTDVIEEKFSRIFNPLECLKLKHFFITDIVFSYEEIYQPLMKYYYENSNRENVIKKMDKYIFLNKYVELDIAMKIFFDNHYANSAEHFIRKHFHIHVYSNKEYLSLEEIFNYYDKIKKNCSASYSDIKDISFEYSRFLFLIRDTKFTLEDIIFVSSKFKIRIDPMNYIGQKIYIQLDPNLTKREIWRLFRHID